MDDQSAERSGEKHAIMWDEAKQTAMQAEAEKMMSETVKRAEEIAAPVCNDMFDSMYASMPENLKAQRSTLRTSSLGQNPAQLPTQDTAHA